MIISLSVAFKYNGAYLLKCLGGGMSGWYVNAIKKHLKRSIPWIESSLAKWLKGTGCTFLKPIYTNSRMVDRVWEIESYEALPIT